MKKGSCKICRFLDFQKWNRAPFEKRVREGSSLRILQAYLEGLGLRCDTKTISKHIQECMEIEVKEQRRIEKALLKAKDPIRKLREIFQKKEHLPKPCEHRATRKQFNMVTEKIDEYCLSCGELLGAYSPDRGEVQDRKKNMVIYASLSMRKRT